MIVIRKKRLNLLLLFLIVSFILSLFPNLTLNTIANQQKITNNLNVNDDLQEYSFSDLGLIIEPLSWSNVGTFQVGLNKTFDLMNSGPTILVIEYSSEGEKPDNPGYKISGTFNQIEYYGEISRAMILVDTPETKSQLVIPLNSSGRVFANNLNLTITAKNEIETENSGKLTVHGSSKLLIGNAIVPEEYGIYQIELYPSKLSGSTTLGGSRFQSYIQFTIFNETLISNGNYNLIFTYEYQGEITYSIFLFDEQEDAFQIKKTEISENIFNASSAIEPNLGLNIFTLELAIYSDNLWSENFNLTFTGCFLVIEPTNSGWGFDNLVIPFFNWPNYPTVGIIILSVWILPYTVLKYREWKKLPGEVEINFFEDDDSFNVLDPEGLSAGDDFDIDDNFDFEEEI
ncbi:MAG: hypothetical protein EAX90_05210 [Candidatus Heimdallarchaeota archaeon]|nr:hypothetical protein [Candidatus Heimdallarchaeota archaeon]